MFKKSPRRQAVHGYVPAKAFWSALGPLDVRCREEKKKKSRSNCPQLAGEHGQKTCVVGCYRVQVFWRVIRRRILTVCSPYWASRYLVEGGGEKGKLDGPVCPPIPNLNQWVSGNFSLYPSTYPSKINVVTEI